METASAGAPRARRHSSPPGGRQRAFPGAGAVAGGLVLAAALAGRAPAAPAAGDTPSGLPVPRYVSTKFKEVNARGGPGDDHRMLWTYRAKGVPLQVVAETDEWRRVCDPDGGLGWVHKRTVAETRTAMRTAARDLPLRARPTDAARAVAVLASRATARLDRCERGWCRLSVDRTSGWVRAGEVWGAEPGARCR